MVSEDTALVHVDQRRSLYRSFTLCFTLLHAIRVRISQARDKTVQMHSNVESRAVLLLNFVFFVALVKNQVFTGTLVR